MAAMVASHHSGLWQPERSADEGLHMNMPSYLPPSGPPTHSRSYHQTSLPQSVPHYGQTVGVFLPFNGSYGFDNLSVHPYAVPQQMPMSYPQSSMLPTSAYVPTVDSIQNVQVTRDTRSNIGGVLMPKPSLKQEQASASQSFESQSSDAHTYRRDSCISETGCAPVVFNTHVDNLMKTIQATNKEEDAQKPSEHEDQSSSDSGHSSASSQKSRKRYRCTFNGCNSRFHQKTHLDIHVRAHTGQKPFVCSHAGCGQAFSQLGNLRTHERRHSGEKPFACDECGKCFAQRGNVRSHKITHTNAKPFVCRLDNCDKPFTQLGNLKTHQNKFHVDTINYLTNKFASVKEGDYVDPKEKDLWSYFANLYKNSNKGIKGRGKDRRISTTASARGSQSPRKTAYPTTNLMPHALQIPSQHPQQTFIQSAPVSPARGLYSVTGAGQGMVAEHMARQTSGGSAASSFDGIVSAGPAPLMPAGMGMGGFSFDNAGQVHMDMNFGDRKLY